MLISKIPKLIGIFLWIQWYLCFFYLWRIVFDLLWKTWWSGFMEHSVLTKIQKYAKFYASSSRTLYEEGKNIRQYPILRWIEYSDATLYFNLQQVSSDYLYDTFIFILFIHECVYLYMNVFKIWECLYSIMPHSSEISISKIACSMLAVS